MKLIYISIQSNSEVVFSKYTPFLVSLCMVSSYVMLTSQYQVDLHPVTLIEAVVNLSSSTAYLLVWQIIGFLGMLHGTCIMQLSSLALQNSPFKTCSEFFRVICLPLSFYWLASPEGRVHRNPEIN